MGVNRSRVAADYGVDPLTAAEADARAMARLAADSGVERQVTLLGSEATVDRLAVAIADALDSLSKDGFLMLTFAGHGLSLGPGGSPDERVDQLLVLSDGLFCDDCLSDLLSRATSSARLLLIFDCCYADGMAEVAAQMFVTRSLTAELASRDVQLPSEAVKRACDGCEATSIAASTLLLSACDVLFESGETGGHGCFTAALLDAVSEGADTSYESLYEHAKVFLRERGMPQPIFRFFAGRDDEPYWNARPFGPLPH